jgi:hypothetical protein
VLRRIFGPKTDEVTGGWRKLQNEELHILYTSPTIIWNDQVKKDGIGRACSMNGGENRNGSRIFVGKPEGKRPLERQRHRWVDNIKMDLRDRMGWCIDCIHLAQDRGQWRALANTVMNLQFP